MLTHGDAERGLGGDLGASGGVLAALFDPDPRPVFAPWQEHSQTSQDAAFAVKRTAGGMRERVFRAIAASPDGMTDLELEVALDMAGSTLRPRRVELHQAGRIREAGARLTPSGRKASVWIVAGGDAA